jgi:antibiotic biosynthesis monooxygenase (ABM) superfamily enzyme
MVLPGAQALFGFQLIAVFSQRFEALSEHQQILHLTALFPVAVAIALVMTPAIYHRLAEPHSVSRTFLAVFVALWFVLPWWRRRRHR